MRGKPARRRLAANAPKERKMARGSDFWRKRKKEWRRCTTLQCTAEGGGGCVGDLDWRKDRQTDAGSRLLVPEAWKQANVNFSSG